MTATAGSAEAKGNEQRQGIGSRVTQCETEHARVQEDLAAEYSREKTDPKRIEALEKEARKWERDLERARRRAAGLESRRTEERRADALTRVEALSTTLQATEVSQLLEKFEAGISGLEAAVKAAEALVATAAHQQHEALRLIVEHDLDRALAADFALPEVPPGLAGRALAAARAAVEALGEAERFRRVPGREESAS